MKKNYLIFLFAVCSILAVIFTSLTNYDNKNFYYAFDEKIYLVPVENKLLVKYVDVFDKKNEELFLTNFLFDTGIKWRNNTIVEITANSKKAKDELKTILEARKDVYTC